MSNNHNSLADKVIQRLESEAKFTNGRYPQWGVDDKGFPWPNPVNAEAIAAALFFWHGKERGVDNIFKIEGEIFIGGRKITKDRTTLLSLFRQPKIVCWADKSSQQDSIASSHTLWKQIKSTINSEWPIIWAKVVEIAPVYDKGYIRIAEGLIWGKEEGDILFW